MILAHGVGFLEILQIFNYYLGGTIMDLNEFTMILEEVVTLLSGPYLTCFCCMIIFMCIRMVARLVAHPSRQIEEISIQVDLRKPTVPEAEESSLEYILNTPLNELVDKELQRFVDDDQDYDYSIDGEIQELIEKYDRKEVI